MNRAGCLGSLDCVLIIFLVFQLIDNGLDDPSGLGAAGTGCRRVEAGFQIGWQGQGDHTGNLT